MTQATTETRFESGQQGGWAILRPVGEVDAYWASRLRDHMTRLLEGNGYHLVVDLSAVQFLDSTGIGVLMGGLKRAQARGGEVRLAAATTFVSRVLEITGLDQVFPAFESVSAAVDATV